MEAPSAKESQTKLLAEGLTDLALKEEEVMAAAQAGFSKDSAIFGEPVTVSAADRLTAIDNPVVTFWDGIRTGIKQSLSISLLIVAVIAVNAVRGDWFYTGLGGIALIAWLLFIICVSLPSIYYHKLIAAADWNRWNEVLSLVAALKAIGRLSFIKVPAAELARHRAKAIAALGRVEEALAEYQQYEGRPDCPPWLHKLFVASIYVTLKQYDKAIELNRAVIAENNLPIAWADLAYRYARYKRDPVKAREAMNEALKSPTPDAVKPNRHRCEGVIAYLNGDYARARQELETAIQMVEQTKWRPYRDGHLAIARGYLCCVLAQQGNIADAKTCLSQAKPYLIATQESELLEECRHLIGEKVSS
jgi:tetratricopeptide (TPR) repeat protein